MLTRTTRDQFATLLDAALWRAEAPDRPVLHYVHLDGAAETISQAAFRAGVAAQAALLHGLGARPGDLVIIAHDQDLTGIFRFWAALWLGAVPSFFPPLTEKLDPTVYRANMATLVEHSGAKLLLTNDEHLPLLAETVGCPVVGDSLVAETGGRLPAAQSAPANIAFLQHSSGTTGLQKGVALSHAAVLNQLASYSEAIELSAADVVVSWLPLYHDMGLFAGFLLPLFQGVPLVLLSPFAWVRRPALLLEAISRHGGTLCWLPNFAYNHCARRVRAAELEGLSLASMRLFVNCSEPVRAESHEQFLARFAILGVRPEMLAVSYAMAENSFAVTQTRPMEQPAVLALDTPALRERLVAEPAGPNGPATRLVSCGHPIAGSAVRVVDERGQLLPERHVGEILVHSDCMLTGYYHRPDLQPFQTGWYLTGDRGFLAAGELYVIGRSKDLIINAGKNVYPQDIEAVINKLPGIHPGRVVVFGVPDEREGTELIAVVAETSSEEPAARKRLNQQIRQAVARQTMVTVTYVGLVPPKWLLKTSSGKIARAANRDKWLLERLFTTP